jgi:hypothetical protein
MSSQRFVLRDATIAITFDETGKKIATTIPAGTEVAVTDVVPLEPTANDSEQISVSWEGRTLSMFLTDLQTRGERVRLAIGSSSQSPKKSN